MSLNYAELSLEDPRVEYYVKKGIGKHVPVPGVAGLGSGISHSVYHVPKSELLTLNQVRKIEKNKYNVKKAVEAEATAAANLVHKDEINANVASIVYTNQPTAILDIDRPIHLESLADKAMQLIAKKILVEKKPRSLSSITRKNGSQFFKYKDKEINIRPGFSAQEEFIIHTENPSVDKAIEELRNAFIELEKRKISPSSYLQAKASLPKNSSGNIIREFQGSVTKRADKFTQEHIDRIMPKINAILEKVHEGMIIGFPSVPAPVAPKEENLIRFDNLSSIDFSQPPGSAAGSSVPIPVDHFQGLGGRHKNYRRRSLKKTRKANRK